MRKDGIPGKVYQQHLKDRDRSTTVAGAFPKFATSSASILHPIPNDKTVS
jgi:hypothetical protein